MSKPSKQKRYRTFAFVQKIENLPETWEQDFQDMICESCYIVHDQDEGTKPHVHFLLYFQGKKSIDGVLESIPETFKVGYIEAIASKTAYIRYMLHWNERNQEEGKHRYEWKELKLLGGMRVNAADVGGVTLDNAIDAIQELQPASLYDFILLCKQSRPELLRYTQTHYQLLEKLILSSCR